MTKWYDCARCDAGYDSGPLEQECTCTKHLAKRAVACKRWRWMPGMLWWLSSRAFERYELVDGPYPTEQGALPDLTDPATLGCVLVLVREAWGDPTLHVWYSRQLGLWVVSASGQEIGVQETTEAEALVAALEAAP